MMRHLNHLLMLGLLIMSFALLAPAALAQSEDTYVVQPGDTLAGIAAKYLSSVDAIAARNSIINANSIRVGQVLYIPRPGSNVNTTVRTYTVQRGDRLVDIAYRYNTTVDAITQANNITASSYIYPGQVLVLPSGSSVVTPNRPTTPSQPTTPTPVRRVTVNGYYQVQPGDTMFAIGASFGVDIYNIARANGILNLNRIYSGQWLRIPGY